MKSFEGHVHQVLHLCSEEAGEDGALAGRGHGSLSYWIWRPNAKDIFEEK